MFGARLIAAAALASIMTPMVASAQANVDEMLKERKEQRRHVVQNREDLERILAKAQSRGKPAPFIVDRLKALRERIAELSASIKKLKDRDASA